MSWRDILDHDSQIERFRHAARNRRLPSTFLFVGPSGVGKRTFARKLAQALLCETHTEQELEACGTCPGCQQVMADSHPDMILVTKPVDRSFIPVETFIGDREHRMREGLCHDIGLKPFRGRRKVAIIDDADYLNEEGANSLLKTLEEPPADSLLILIATSEQKQLPTIRSRCQIVRFGELSEPVLARLILAQQIVDTPELAAELAAMAHGSLVRAHELADVEYREFRESFLQQLASPPWRQNELAGMVNAFVEAAGKEAPPRRLRLRQVIGIALDLLRELLAARSGEPLRGDRNLQLAVRGLAADWKWGPDAIASCLDVSLSSLGYVDANATPQNIIEYWMDELTAICLSGRMTAASH